MRKNLENQRHGKWLVLRRIQSSRSGATIYECRCDCGTIKQVYSTHLIRGKSRGCQTCSIRRGSKHHQWKGIGTLSGNFWDSIKRSADGSKGKRKSLQLDFTIEDAWDLFCQQNKSCALTGLKLTMPNPPSIKGTASLDRIDSGKGYLLDNVQWVHKDINMMKRTYSQEYFIEMCKAVAEHK